VQGKSDIADLLCKAGAQGDIRTLQLLQDGEADLSTQDYFGLSVAHAAAANGHIEALKWLNTQDFQFEICDIEGYTPVYRAKEAGHEECEEFLENIMLGD